MVIVAKEAVTEVDWWLGRGGKGSGGCGHCKAPEIMALYFYINPVLPIALQ